jgi:hypothetical protein
VSIHRRFLWILLTAALPINPWTAPSALAANVDYRTLVEALSQPEVQAVVGAITSSQVATVQEVTMEESAPEPDGNGWIVSSKVYTIGYDLLQGDIVCGSTTVIVTYAFQVQEDSGENYFSNYSATSAFDGDAC